MGTFAGSNDGSSRKKSVILAIALPLVIATVLLVIGVCLILRRQKKRAETMLIEKGKLRHHKSEVDNVILAMICSSFQLCCLKCLTYMNILQGDWTTTTTKIKTIKFAMKLLSYHSLTCPL